MHCMYPPPNHCILIFPKANEFIIINAIEKTLHIVINHILLSAIKNARRLIRLKQHSPYITEWANDALHGLVLQQEALLLTVF